MRFEEGALRRPFLFSGLAAAQMAPPGHFFFTVAGVRIGPTTGTSVSVPVAGRSAFSRDRAETVLLPETSCRFDVIVGSA